jgi:hypothetical protein
MVPCVFTQNLRHNPHAGPHSAYAECKEVAFEAAFFREKNKVEVVGRACLRNGWWRLVAAEE